MIMLGSESAHKTMLAGTGEVTGCWRFGGGEFANTDSYG
jgi:hypothetical protein